jgi:hypothetical protein
MLLVNHPYGTAVEPAVGFAYGRRDLPMPLSAMSREHFSVVGVGADTVTIHHTGQAAGSVSGESVSTGMGVILRVGGKYFPVTAWDTFYFELTEPMVEERMVEVPAVEEMALDPVVLAVVEHGDTIVPKVEATAPYDESAWKDKAEDNKQLKLFIENDKLGELGHIGLYEIAANVAYSMFNPVPDKDGETRKKKGLPKEFPRIPMLEKMRAAKLRSDELDALDQEQKFGKGSIFHSSTLLERPKVPKPQGPEPIEFGENEKELKAAPLKKKKRIIKPTKVD